jgi:hypothetical protein
MLSRDSIGTPCAYLFLSTHEACRYMYDTTVALVRRG